MSGLAGIRERAEAYARWGTPGQRAPQDRADLLAILGAIEEAIYGGGHADWCDDYWGSDGTCRCWKADMLAALNGPAQ